MMVSNLLKTPLLAVVYGAVAHLAVALVPYSERMREAIDAAEVQRIDFLYLLAFGLWVSVMIAIAFASVKGNGVGALLPVLIPVLGAVCVVPLLLQFITGEVTGVMTRSDTVWTLAVLGGSALVTLALATLLFHKEDKVDPNESKYRIKPLMLMIKLLVLPFIFLVLYVLAWYFLAWRNEGILLYYTGGTSSQGFVAELINLLLTNAKMVPLQMLKGLLYALCTLPLLLRMPGKRGPFIALCVLLFASGALLFLLPNPVMPWHVRIAHLLEHAALLAVYGVLTGLLLHTTFSKEVAAISEPRPGSSSQTGTSPRPAVAGAVKR